MLPSGPSLLLLVPEVSGVTSFRIHRFYDTDSAQAFLRTLPPGAVSGVHAFWALDDRPDDTPTGEAMVLIRSDQVSDLVYVVSFVDVESALSFARFEVKRGMNLGLLMVYWAELVTIGLTGDEIVLTPDQPPASGNRRPQLVQPTAPHFEQQPAAYADPAPSSDSVVDDEPEALTPEPPAAEPEPVASSSPEPVAEAPVDEEPLPEPIAAAEGPMAADQETDALAEGADTADMPGPEPASDATVPVASEGEPGAEEPAPEPSAAAEEPPVLEQQSDVSGTGLDTVTETEPMASGDVPLDTEPEPLTFAKPEPTSDATVQVADEHALEVEPISAEEPSESEVWDLQSREVVQDEEAPDNSVVAEAEQEDPEEDSWADQLKGEDDRPRETPPAEDPDLPSLAELVEAMEERYRIESGGVEAAATDDHQFGDESSAPITAEAPEFLREEEDDDTAAEAAEEWRPAEDPSLDEDGSPPDAGASNGGVPDTKPSPIPEPVFASNGTGPHEDPDEPPEHIPGEDNLNPEMAEFLKSRRRDKKEKPFGGFNSPPGRF